MQSTSKFTKGEYLAVVVFFVFKFTFTTFFNSCYYSEIIAPRIIRIDFLSTLII